MAVRKIITVLIITCAGLQWRCEHSSQPILVKSPREYTWTIDTVYNPNSSQTTMCDVWGISPSDVYMVGRNSGARGLMWHYDGKKWTDVKLWIVDGGPIDTKFDLTAICGFGSNHVVAVGYIDFGGSNTFQDSSLIIHFDGSRWRVEKLGGGRMLQSIWGISPNDIWAAGWNTVFHYDGVGWQKFPCELPPQGIQFIRITGFSARDVYMIGARNDTTALLDAFFLYRFDGNSWAVIDSVVRFSGSSGEDNFGENIFAIDGQLFSARYGIYKRFPGGWQKMILLNDPISRLRGTSASNLFAVGTQSQVWHYDGSSWYRFPQFSGNDKTFMSIWTDGTEVFVVGHNGTDTYVLHGK